MMRGMGDFWDVVTFKPIRDAAGDALEWTGNLPLLHDLAVGPLRDFANTAVGHAVLVAISSTFYGSLVPFMGPQLASTAFAVPGLLTGDDFSQAWLTGVKERAEQTAEILGGDVANIFSQQLTDTLQKMADDYGVDNAVSDSIATLIDRYGIRQDVATFAKSLWNKIEIPTTDLENGMFDLATGDLRSGVLRLQGAGISPATLASSAVVGTWTGDNDRATLTTLARAANYNGFSEYATPPAPPRGYASANTSPNRASGDVLLGVSIAAAVGALAFFYWPKRRR